MHNFRKFEHKSHDKILCILWRDNACIILSKCTRTLIYLNNIKNSIVIVIVYMLLDVIPWINETKLLKSFLDQSRLNECVCTELQMTMSQALYKLLTKKNIGMCWMGLWIKEAKPYYNNWITLFFFFNGNMQEIKPQQYVLLWSHGKMRGDQIDPVVW